MTEISEDVIVAEAQVVATRLVEWFQERLLATEGERDAAVEARVVAEDDRRVANVQREAAVEARVVAEDDRRVADVQREAAVRARVAAEDDRRAANAQRALAERRIIEVERLLAASEELAEQLQQALDSRIVIEQAKGFLAARHGVTPGAAFEAMRQHARSHSASLRGVAAETISGTLHLTM